MMQGSGYVSSSSEQNLERANQLAKYLSKIDTFNQNHIFLSKLLPRNKITYIDQHQFYAIIEGKYLKQLLKITQQGTSKIQQLNQKLLTKQKQNTYTHTKLTLLENKIQKLQQNEAKLITSLGNKDQQIDNLTNEVKDKQKNIRNLIQQNFRINKDKMIQQDNQNTTKLNNILSKSVQVQTQYILEEHENDINSIQETKQKAKGKILENNNNFDKPSKLIQIFQQTLGEITNKMQQKIKNLNQHLALSSQTQKKYQQVCIQNENLKKQLRQINESEEKIKLWKDSISGFLNKVQKSTQSNDFKLVQHQDIVDQDQQSLIAKIQRLQKKLLEQKVQKISFDLKIKKMQEVMDCTEELSDDNAVTNLVKISQKIKLIVRELLSEL